MITEPATNLRTGDVLLSMEENQVSYICLGVLSVTSDAHFKAFQLNGYHHAEVRDGEITFDYDYGGGRTEMHTVPHTPFVRVTAADIVEQDTFYICKAGKSGRHSVRML